MCLCQKWFRLFFDRVLRWWFGGGLGLGFDPWITWCISTAVCCFSYVLIECNGSNLW